MNVAVKGKRTRSRPGRPDTPLTDPLLVGGTQKRAPVEPEEVLPEIGLAVPVTVTEPPTTPLSRKQSRNFPSVRVSPACGQSALVVQPRNVSCGVQNSSNGPTHRSLRFR